MSNYDRSGPTPTAVSALRRELLFLSQPARLTLGAFVALVTAMSAAHAAGAFPLATISSSPSEISEGELWLLASSALVAQQPLILALGSLAAAGAVAGRLGGWRVMWVSAIVGHVFSTLLAYAVLRTAHAANLGHFGALSSAPDYGVSAIFAAWLGVIAACLWAVPGARFPHKLAIASGTAVVALVAWAVRGAPGPSLLDLDHVFAFAAGVFIACAALPKQRPVP
jgi:hypothetical protein